MKSEDHVRSAYLRALAVDYAKHFIGVPYLWGGNDPMSGWDCSGFVVEVLQAVGQLPHRLDYTAHDIYTTFKSSIVFLGYAGCLAFWFNKVGTATHVMLLIDGEHVLGAAGGGPTTVNIADAIRQNAFLKMRPLNYRGHDDVPIIVDPFKEII